MQLNENKNHEQAKHMLHISHAHKKHCFSSFIMHTQTAAINTKKVNEIFMKSTNSSSKRNNTEGKWLNCYRLHELMLKPRWNRIGVAKELVWLLVWRLLLIGYVRELIDWRGKNVNETEGKPIPNFLSFSTLLFSLFEREGCRDRWWELMEIVRMKVL